MPTMDSTSLTAPIWLDAFLHGERTLPLPTTLELNLSSRRVQFDIDKIFRLLPAKRVVVRSDLDGKPVVIKLFRKNRSSARHISKEQAGHARVTQAGVPCPPLLGVFTTPCQRFEGVIYSFIDDARELSECWPEFDAEEKKSSIEKLMQVLFALHRHGAWQSDIHAGNFLVRNGQFHLLDLGSVVTARAPLSRPACIANLGQLIAQFDLCDQALFESGIETYCRLQHWSPQQLRPQIDAGVGRAWNDRINEYLAKAKRDCSLTVFDKKFNRLLACRRSWYGDDARRFAKDPNAFMANGDLLKAGNSATVVKTSLDGKPVVIKRYNIKNFSHALSRSFRPTRAEHSWHYAHLLEIAGIASLKPVAWLENRNGYFRSTAWFICEWIDAPDLLSIGNARTLTADELEALRTLLATMLRCKLTHGDFKANNLLLKKTDEGVSVVLIDLDAMRRHRSKRSFRRAFAQDLARLTQNWRSEHSISQQIRSLLDELIH
jgi:tRNA A-37 threonylcarbamoyl transferase component Bud32